MGSPNPQTTPDTQPGFSTTVADTTLSEALITLRKRRWVLIVAALLGMVYGFYKASSQPKLYDAYGKIEVRTGSSNEYRVGGSGENADPSTKMATEIQILQSDSLLLTVAREMNLANNPEFMGFKGPTPHFSLDDPAIRNVVLRSLQGSLRVNLIGRTDLIRIDYSSLNGKLSADIVNRVIADYIQRSFETRFISTQRVSKWLSTQLDDLKGTVESSQERVLDLQKRLGVLGFDTNRSQTNVTLDTLSTAAETARVNRIIAEARYRVLADSDPSTINGFIDTSPGTTPGAFGALRSEAATLRSQYDRLESTLGPNHPQAKELRAQMDSVNAEIAAEQNRVLLQSKGNLVATRAAEDQTVSALEQAKTEAYKNRDSMVELSLLQRDYEQNRNLYEGLLNRLRTAGIQAGLESLEIDTIDPALPPAEPTLQPKLSVMVTTTIFALLGGVIVAFLLDSLDTGLRSVSEIESVTELPSLAVIPRARRSNAEISSASSTAQRNINVLTTPKSQFAEAFRSLRTSLLLSTAGHPPKFILFTSATPSEGKTTTATNLACILAQRDTRVLLMDADLRRPNVHHRFGLTGKTGLSTVLTGATTLEETVQRIVEVPNLDILPSGPVPPFPTEMLGSEAMQNLFAHCATIYTHIVIDSPPILSVTDGVVLARVADAVALVIRHGKSSKHVVRRARDLLLRAGAPVTGIVLNAVDLNSPEYYGYYGYSGYSYSSIDSESWEANGKTGSRKQPKGRPE